MRRNSVDSASRMGYARRPKSNGLGDEKQGNLALRRNTGAWRSRPGTPPILHREKSPKQSLIPLLHGACRLLAAGGAAQRLQVPARAGAELEAEMVRTVAPPANHLVVGVEYCLGVAVLDAAHENTHATDGLVAR